MTTDCSELESLLAPIRSSFHAKRRDIAAQCDELGQLLAAYLKAIDTEILREIAKNHGLSIPPIAPGPGARELAQGILARVQNLPENRQKPADSSAAPAASQTLFAVANVATTREERPSASLGPSTISTPTSLRETRRPKLDRQLSERPLIIVGGPPHLERFATAGLPENTTVEWIDTTRQGTHAIGNLERRIKDHRIGAIIILEGLVQHRHSDPLVSTARGSNVLSAYAGKGGRSALAKALDELERMFENHR